MTGPGRRVHALATRWCSERARRRLIDPALADLQTEYAAARRTGSRARMVRALATGYVAIAKVLVIGGCGDFRAELRSWQPAERAGARGGAWVGLVIIALATALLEVPLLTRMDVSAWLSIYLIPQALPLSVPLGLAVAVAWTLCGVARTRKLAAAALVVAALAAATMFANVAWVLPEANQAFRQRAFEQLAPHANPPRRGDNELTWSEARKRQADLRARSNTAAVRAFESTYYLKWAMSLAPLPIVGLIVAIAFRRAWTRAGLTSVALGLCASHFALLMSTRTLANLEILPPIVLGWSADAICMLAAVVLACGSRAVTKAPPAPTR